MMISRRAEGCTLPLSALVSPEVFLLVVGDASFQYTLASSVLLCILLYQCHYFDVVDLVDLTHKDTLKNVGNQTAESSH